MKNKELTVRLAKVGIVLSVILLVYMMFTDNYCWFYMWIFTFFGSIFVRRFCNDS